MTRKLVQSVARSLGLTQATAKIAYGVAEGHLAQVQLIDRNNAKDLRVFFRHAGQGKEDAVRGALAGSPEAKAAGLEPKHVFIDGGTAMLTVPQRPFVGIAKEKVVLARVRAMLDALKASSAPEGQTCRLCATAVSGEPVLLHGLVDRVCPSCIERLEHEARMAQAEYASRPLNLPVGLAAALLAGCAGAALYGGVMVLFQRMLWALAIVTGLMVGYAATKGAGKGGRVVQAMAALVTVASVLAGFLGFMGYEINQEVVAQGGKVDWGRFIAQSPALLMQAGRGTIFSLAGALFGAWTSIKRASPPGFEAVHSSAQPAAEGQFKPG